MNLKPLIFLFVLLNVLILHIFLFYNFSLPKRNLEIKKDTSFFATLTVIHESNAKVSEKKEKVLVKKEKILTREKKVVLKKAKIPIKKAKVLLKKVNIPMKKEKVEIVEKTNLELLNQPETMANESKSNAKPVESSKSNENKVDPNIQDKYLNEYIEYVNNVIQSNKFYPKLAKNMRIEGKCTITLTIVRSGAITNAKVVEKSYYPLFDKSALKILDIIETFKSFPNLLEKEMIILKIPIKYTLKG